MLTMSIRKWSVKKGSKYNHEIGGRGETLWCYTVIIHTKSCSWNYELDINGLELTHKSQNINRNSLMTLTYLHWGRACTVESAHGIAIGVVNRRGQWNRMIRSASGECLVLRSRRMSFSPLLTILSWPPWCLNLQIWQFLWWQTDRQTQTTDDRQTEPIALPFAHVCGVIKSIGYTYVAVMKTSKQQWEIHSTSVPYTGKFLYGANFCVFRR